MRQKPWPIVLLALLHVLMPLFNAMIAARLSGLPLFQYVSLFLKTQSFTQIATHFLLLPIAGWAIFAFRSWSYPVYLAAMAWASYDTLWNFHSLPHLTNFGSFLIPIAVNLVLISYFLFPSVRELYFNKSLRWWESQERLPFKLACVLETSSKKIPAEIQNISEGGCFLRIAEPISQGDGAFRIFFSFDEHDFELPSTLMHLHGMEVGAGFRFVLNRWQMRQTRRLVRTLKREGVKALNRVPLDGRSFMKWVKRLLKTGRGIFPERD